MAVAKKSSTDRKKLSSKSNSRVKLVKNTIKDTPTEKMISEAAYYIAQQRDFKGGDTMQDWLQAEQSIQQQLNIHQ